MCLHLYSYSREYPFPECLSMAKQNVISDCGSLLWTPGSETAYCPPSPSQSSVSHCLVSLCCPRPTDGRLTFFFVSFWSTKNCILFQSDPRGSDGHTSSHPPSCGRSFLPHCILDRRTDWFVQQNMRRGLEKHVTFFLLAIGVGKGWRGNGSECVCARTASRAANKIMD